MPFNKGDFVLVEYDLMLKDTGQLIDTTDAEKAKKAGIFDERERYGPRLVIVGEGRLLPGLEEVIAQMNVGEEREVEIPPEKAYGKRDPKKVKIIPKTQFLRHGVVPEPGKVVEIDGQPAVIRSIQGGRVIVDFNHPLAGRTLKARVKVVRKLEGVDEKVKWLLLRRLPPTITEEDVRVTYNPERLRVDVELPGEKILNVPEATVVKRLVVDEIRRYMPREVAEVAFHEQVRLQSS